MADVKSSLFCHFDKLPELNRESFTFVRRPAWRHTVIQAFSVHKACF